MGSSPNDGRQSRQRSHDWQCQAKRDDDEIAMLIDNLRVDPSHWMEYRRRDVACSVTPQDLARGVRQVEIPVRPYLTTAAW
jgi:hypothetical protein